MAADAPPGVGHFYQAVWLPQLQTVLDAFEDQKGLIVALADSVNALLATIANEFGELKTKFDDLKAQVAAGQDAEAALAAMQANMDAVETQIQEATTQVADLSTAADDAPPAEPTA